MKWVSKVESHRKYMDYLLLMLFLYLSWLLLKLLQFITNTTRPCTRNNNLPPGPRPLPVLGNLLELGSLPHKSLARLAKTHGPLMSLKLGQVTTIVVSSASVAREILQTHDINFSSRTIPDVVRAHGQDELGLPWVPISPLWRTLRRICNVHLFAQSTLDASRHLRREKVQELVSYVGELAKTGKSVDIGEAAFMTSLNLVSNTIFSTDLAGPRSKSSSAREFKEIVEHILVEAGKPNISDYFPALKPLDVLGAKRRMTRYFGRLLNLSEELINKRLQEREADRSNGLEKKKNDLLDVLLQICEDKKENMMEVFRIKHLCMDLFIAGTDTTSNTIEWAMAELVRNPDKLARAQAELEQVIGQGNQLEEPDIPRLPYLQAVVKETLRVHPPVPLSIPRKVGSSIDINGGYTVPEGAQLLINVWAIGRDTSSWEDPDRFEPERFLGSNVDVKGHHFELVPFGGGRRICPGLPLAMRMLHLMLGSLVHSFGWRLEPGLAPEKMDMEDKFGITIRKAQPLRIVPIPK